MHEQDFSKRMVIIVRKDLLNWQVANAIAHVSAYIGNALQDSFATGQSFYTKDGKSFPRNSQYPIIIKRATSSEQLLNTLNKARDAEVLHQAFISEMIETTDDNEIEKISKDKTEAEIELLAIGIFGANDEVATITKKFGLWE